ncbi:[FeFe] hydrogenase H-cluster maturation GTPase HydF [Mitsuokella sp.]|uniref:[FeFe] hydrogenase H-cluster maturation GTPase HydF n=1 Tax=Mitsuokella sp. TaxID=2049034 RepID=UPI003D7CAFDF
MSLNDTPRAMRLHIGLFGRRNSGKSSLVNALTGQNVATVSPVPGTTTDPVYKAMEIHGIGPVVFIDTAGFDDVGSLGGLRVSRTKDAAKETDIALVLFHQEEAGEKRAAEDDFAEEFCWLQSLQKRQIPVIPVVSRTDEMEDGGRALAKCIFEGTKISPVCISSKTGAGIEKLRAEIARQLPEDYQARSITGEVCQSGGHVLLVMPQDIQAPKGRLILPQVQTLRELLDRKCLVSCCTTDCLPGMLASFVRPPELVITDSQAFREVHALLPKGSKLTSFSVLFAAYKGDAAFFAASARQLLELPADAHILIAEACTHKPLQEDIGRVKLPRLLRRNLGKSIEITVCSGHDFPENLSSFDMVIHCGACMFNRAYVMSRAAACRRQNIPMTNYGMAIAALLGILDDVRIPGVQ